MTEIRHKTIGFCEVPGSLGNVTPTAAHLRSFCEDRLIDPSVWSSIELGFCETLNNAIEHGCGEDETLHAKVRWEWDNSGLRIEIEDPGEPYSPDKKPELPESALSESGRGLYIVEMAFDSVQHERCPHGHRVILEKALPNPEKAISQLQESYESIHCLGSELSSNVSYRNGQSSLAAALSEFEGIERGMAILKDFARFSSVEVWILAEDRLENRFQDDPDKQANEVVATESLDADSWGAALGGPNQIYQDRSSKFPKESIAYSKFDDTLIQSIALSSRTIGILVARKRLSPGSRFDLEQKDSLLFAANCLALKLGSSLGANSPITHGDTQLEAASEIQKSLLPSSFPSNDHCRLTGRCVTAMAVGGDYIDAIDIRGQGLLLVIADVMGKGVPAALLATVFRTAIRSRLHLAETPGWLLAQTDKQIFEELGHLNLFITAQAAYFSYSDNSLKLSCAGHCPAFLLRNGESNPDCLTAEGLPLGIQPTDLYEERITSLGKGDRLLFITDGVYEAHDESGQAIGLDNFTRHVSSIWQDGLEAVPDNTLALADDGAFQDDKTLMALEVL